MVLAHESIAPAISFLDPAMKHYPGGLPYWIRPKPGSDPVDRELYQPSKVPEDCALAAGQFIGRLADEYSDGIHPVAISLELPGPAVRDQWFEWNQWLYRVLKKTDAHKSLHLRTAAQLATAISPADRNALPRLAGARPRRADSASWIGRHIVECQESHARSITAHGATRNPKLRQILGQCGRELLLLQAGDWRDLMLDPAANDYAALRFARHRDDFRRLVGLAEKIAAGRFLSEGERTYVARLMERDRCFEEVPLQNWNENPPRKSIDP
jgi:predicted glycosyl hydrolase (DUF1957 family)